MRGPWAIAVGLGAIVVATILAVTVAGRGPATFPPDSPESTLQAYLLALQAGDAAAAYDLLSESAKRGLSLSDLRRTVNDYRGYDDQGHREVVIDRVAVVGDHATIFLTVEVGYGVGLFESSSYTYPAQVELIHEQGGWRMRSPIGPELNAVKIDL